MDKKMYESHHELLIPQPKPDKRLGVTRTHERDAQEGRQGKREEEGAGLGRNRQGAVRDDRGACRHAATNQRCFVALASPSRSTPCMNRSQMRNAKWHSMCFKHTMAVSEPVPASCMPAASTASAAGQLGLSRAPAEQRHPRGRRWTCCAACSWSSTGWAAARA